MAYSDKQLKEATQVAYLECLEKSLKSFEGEEHDGFYSVKELIEASIDRDSIARKAQEDGKDINAMSLQEMIKYSDLRDLDKEIIEGLNDEMLEWRIADIHDMNSVNGFYSCVIETSEDEAIVAFRGSESNTLGEFKKDWIQADFGLLNSDETLQQDEVNKYSDKLIRNGVLDKYKSLAVTGHSLGGNLSTHFAVANASNDYRKSTFNKINQVVSFDGPGFSKEYIKSHEEAINKAAPKVTHYKWSTVGSLLYDIPGEKDEYLKIDEEQHKESIIDRIKYKTFYRHHTKSIMFDENGNAERGKQDFLANVFEKISKTVENVPAVLTQSLGYVATSIFNSITYEKEDGSVGFKLPFTKKGKENANMNQIRCGDLINEYVDNYKVGAKCIEMTKGGKCDEKIAYEDVLKAAVNDEQYNINGVNNTIEMFKADRNKERQSENEIGRVS